MAWLGGGGDLREGTVSGTDPGFFRRILRKTAAERLPTREGGAIRVTLDMLFHGNVSMKNRHALGWKIRRCLCVSTRRSFPCEAEHPRLPAASEGAGSVWRLTGSPSTGSGNGISVGCSHRRHRGCLPPGDCIYGESPPWVGARRGGGWNTPAPVYACH